MRIWTSYFASPALRDRPDLVRLAVTRWPPRWRGAFDEEFKSLAPIESIFEASPTRFANLYRRQLDRLGVARIAAELGAVSRRHGGRDVVLLCFEAKAQECHRSLFAAWWEQHGGPRIEEIPKSTPRARCPKGQLPLPLEEVSMT